MTRKIGLVTLLSALVLLLAVVAHASANTGTDEARALFDKAVLLLNRTGGIASFYTLPGLAPGRPNLHFLPPDEVSQALDTVISDLREVIKLDPGIKAAHYFLGVAYLKKMDGDKAIREFYTAINVEPHRELTYMLLCELLWRYKRYQDAIGVVHRYRAELPESKANIATLAGNTHFFMGDYHKALLYGLSIMQMDSSNPEGLALSASSYYCLGNREAADELFKKLEADPRIRGKVPAIMLNVRKKCGSETPAPEAGSAGRESGSRQ